MLTEDFLDAVVAAVNNKRVPGGLPELQTFLDPPSPWLAFDEVLLLEHPDEVAAPEEARDAALATLEAILGASDDNNANYLSMKAALMSSHATHLELRNKGDAMVAQVYNRYFELDPAGPIIGGDMVVSGTVMVPGYGPALCTIEYAADHEETFTNIATIAPWQIMFTPGEGDDSSTFSVPFTVPAECREGTLSIRIGAAAVEKIPFDEAKDDYALDAAVYIRAVEFTKSSKEADQGDTTAALQEDEAAPESGGSTHSRNPLNTFSVNEDADPAQQQAQLDAAAAAESAADTDHIVVRNIHILSDLDELDKFASQGCELNTLTITKEGMSEDYPTQWKFYVVAEMGLASDGGIEDIVWIQTQKSTGGLPSMEGYDVVLEDLSNVDDNVSVFLALKKGGRPKYSKMTMLAGADNCEETTIAYISNSPDDFQRSPPEICNIFGGLFGLMLTRLDVDPAKAAKLSSGGAARGLEVGEDGFEERGAEDEELRKYAAQVGGTTAVRHHERGDLTGSETPDSMVGDEFEDATAASMHQRIAEVEMERDRLKDYNAEIQRKASAMMARDKAMAGVPTGKAEAAANAAAAAAAGDPAAAAENELEKEKHFSDVLQLVSECRKKLFRQQQEFDQLAHDLQTRLDDKEYKASEIAASFQEFKREIMGKAQNSRTGKPMAKRLMEQYEVAEQRKDSDLEKVRLRNISLRTSLKKLERQLRAREQLAEGLHMIDFEQLKIENQTWNEKIEERNEELAKLKRKKTATVQVLTHIREKLKFVENQNGQVKKELADIEHAIMGQRAVLTGAKHDRDFVRDDNLELKRKQGFATNDLLLIDYEQRKTLMESVKEEIKELQERYSILSAQLNKTSSGGLRTSGSAGSAASGALATRSQSMGMSKPPPPGSMF